ncbi:MAG: 2'-5' RNA ligase family protein [Acidobacteria bacterium]|nr:2'-5' RNA ligase family protein [Acidobacteriota bacterium]
MMAIDVALLLPETVHTRARQINERLWQQRRDGFPFDAGHAPHLTLVQQFIQRENWPILAERVASVLRDRPPLPLRVSSLVSHQSTVLFLVDRTPQLQSLHEALLDAAKPLEETGGTAGAFYADGETAREADVEWVSRYRTHASYANFVPHVTLGIGTVPELAEPFDFLATRVALFHLGRFCTCRVLLREWALETRS